MTTVLALTALALAANNVRPQQSVEQGLYLRDSVQQIEGALASYLNGEEAMSILTPGEFSEWKQSLKAGQVLVAGARSQAFDPALEVVDEQGTVVAKSDDRYPGDQRPLLFWRCERDGAYALRARCFRDKSGGQVFVSFNTYDTIEAGSSQPAEGTFDATKPFLVRVPMKAGQIKDLVAERRGEGNFINFSFGSVITPLGLPERAPSLGTAVSPAITALVAPLDGDYYVLATPHGYAGGSGRVRILAREFKPEKTAASQSASNAVPSGRPMVWELAVKAGDLIEASVPELDKSCRFVLGEVPDLSKFDLSKAETNPFFPVLRNQPPGPGLAVDMLPARARHNRIMVFRARRDARLWLSSDGRKGAGGSYQLHLRQAASPLLEGQVNPGKLRVANTDYWWFDAQAGDVLNLGVKTSGFSQAIVVRDPDLVEVRRAEAELDQTADSWRMVVQKPGRYLVAVSCVGNGGSGDYALDRTVYRAREFGLAQSARGEVRDGQVQVWKFTVQPNEPLIIKWTSPDWGYGVEVYDDKGQPTSFQRQEIDAHTRLGILKVAQPQTYVVVLTGQGKACSYDIGLRTVAAALKQ